MPAVFKKAAPKQAKKRCIDDMLPNDFPSEADSLAEDM